jgi:hypothetical protein
LGNVFRYPINAALDCGMDVFAVEDTPEDIPIIYAEFRFVWGAWVFDGIK